MAKEIRHEGWNAELGVDPLLERIPFLPWAHTWTWVRTSNRSL